MSCSTSGEPARQGREMTRLLIVDDDEDICTQIKWALGRNYSRQATALTP